MGYSSWDEHPALGASLRDEDDPPKILQKKEKREDEEEGLSEVFFFVHAVLLVLRVAIHPWLDAFPDSCH
jgi:hypothetical protein